MEIQAIDLFCGIGGLTHGLINSGIKVLAGIDVDPTCEYAYSSNNDANFILSDVSSYSSLSLKKMYDRDAIKVLVGCAPCQPFSKLQKVKQEKTKESKWGLLYAFLDHIKKINPEIVSMENVPALIHELVFTDFVNGLKKMGYYVNYYIVDASNYGVPQRRRRIILLASKYGKIELIKPSGIKNKITVKQAIGNLSPLEAGESDKIDKLHRSSNLSNLNLKRIKASFQGGTWKDWDIALVPKCFLNESGKTYTSVYGRMKENDVSPTLTTQFNIYGTGRYGHPTQNRAISLREGAILQSFPINYKFVKDENYNMRDVARQIGNAVPVILGKAIGVSIIRHIKSIG